MKITVGIVEYGVGNYASLRHTLHRLGYRVRTCPDTESMDAVDLLLLPGVGAFPPAMAALQARSFDSYLREQVRRGRPLLGICLGMQLLADVSHEHGRTMGLGIIPGAVDVLESPRWHIGWNTIEAARPDSIFQRSISQAFYFNHSYAFRGPEACQVCTTNTGFSSFASAVRKDAVVGIQFHPEKSQSAGDVLLRDIIETLCHA